MKEVYVEDAQQDLLQIQMEEVAVVVLIQEFNQTANVEQIHVQVQDLFLL